MPYHNKLQCLPQLVTSTLGKQLQARLELTRVEPLTWFDSDGLRQDLPWNISVGWKWLTLENTLAYYDTAKITAVKSFIVQAPGWKSHERDKHSSLLVLFVANKVKKSFTTLTPHCLNRHPFERNLFQGKKTICFIEKRILKNQLLLSRNLSKVLFLRLNLTKIDRIAI